MRTRDGSGNEIRPTDGCVPILSKRGLGRLAVVGTGFWITRYGLFVTAAHVVNELISPSGKLEVGYVLHLTPENKIHLRVVRGVTRLDKVDLAIGQAENYVEKFPQDPLTNRRAPLTTTVPAVGSRLVTYAYPENKILQFGDDGNPPIIRGDYFEGSLLRNVTKSEHPFVRYPHFETSIEVRSGASGGPVFDERGRVVGVNCRGWDFRGTEHEGDHLSIAVPLGALMPIDVPILQVPTGSWEERRIPEARRRNPLTVAELATYGHIHFDL